MLNLQRVFLIGCLSALSACQSTPTPAPTYAPASPGLDPLPAEAYPQIVLHDGLENVLVTEQATIRWARNTRPMMVRIPFRSLSDTSVGAQYRFVFYNSEGDQTTTQPTWRTVSFPPRTRRFVEASAISLEATDWELELRAAR